MKHCLFLAVALSTGLASAQVVYVDPGATGAGTGTSWADAYTDLQPALQAAPTGSEIWVVRGTYYAGPAGNQAATFTLRNGIALYGGFTGVETQRSQRDVAQNPTVLSGDIDQNDTYGAGAQWWRFGWNFNAGNSWHIVTGHGTDATAVLDGFTMFAGLGDDPAGFRANGGAGLYVIGGSPTLRHCTFQYNAVGFGSSAQLQDCNSTFENCVIRDAYTINTGRGGITSGVYSHGVCNLTFTDCQFVNHYYVATMGRGYGAAVHLDRDCRGTFVRCEFIGNQTGNFFAMGDPDGAYGAGIYAVGNDLLVDSCTFVDNFAHGGAGIYTWGSSTVVNSLFARNRAIEYPVNPVVARGDFGAGFATRAGTGETTTLINNIFVENNCDKGAGFAAYCADPAIVRNCVAYHNFADPPLPGQDPIWILKQQIVGNYDLSHCCVEGLLQTEPGEDPPSAANFPDCFDEDPRLMSLTGDDYHLLPTSPCISSGDGAAVPAWLTVDLDGNPRIAGLVDVGCYEFTGTPLPSLVDQNLVQGVTGTYTVHNALPGELTFFAYSFAGVGPGPCLPPPSSLCAGLMPPLGVLTASVADGNGRADAPLLVPASAPLVELHVQAILLRGPALSLSLTTNAISARVYQP